MKSPFVSVIIPVKALSQYLLFENFPALKKQIYKNFEVVVLPNKASKEDKSLLKQYSWLRIIPTGKVTRPAEKRDIGVKKSKGEIIAFIDDDACPASDWLQNAVKFFSQKNIVAVCGPGVLPHKTNLWEKVFDEILKTWTGSGEYAYRFIPQKKRYVDDYPSMNFFVLKKEFLAVGGFNSEYWPGEDSKLCEDLVYRRHGKILYSPTVLTYHHRRDNLLGFLRQHGNYGFHRGAFFAHGDRNSRRISYLIPTFFVLYLILLILNSEYRILYTPLLLYFILGLLLIIQSFRNTKSILISLLTFPVLFLIHTTYGILFIKGFIKGIINKEHIYN
jgi:cellulose synthase/poly-beta-1,6-N-acetylglucosamine synthase-like glycosyltransferase